MHIASQAGHPDTALVFLKKGVPLHMPNKVSTGIKNSSWAKAPQSNTATLSVYLIGGCSLSPRCRQKRSRRCSKSVAVKGSFSGYKN